MKTEEIKELTVKQLEEMQPGIFAKGETYEDNGDTIHWVAVRGGIADWAVYYSYETGEVVDWDWIKDYGNKVITKEWIRELVPCTNEAFRKYRY